MIEIVKRKIIDVLKVVEVRMHVVLHLVAAFPQLLCARLNERVLLHGEHWLAHDQTFSLLQNFAGHEEVDPQRPQVPTWVCVQPGLSREEASADQAVGETDGLEQVTRRQPAVYACTEARRKTLSVDADLVVYIGKPDLVLAQQIQNMGQHLRRRLVIVRERPDVSPLSMNEQRIHVGVEAEVGGVTEVTQTQGRMSYSDIGADLRRGIAAAVVRDDDLHVCQRRPLELRYEFEQSHTQSLSAVVSGDGNSK